MFNHAAFAAEDVEDARRGHPAVDLSAYAHARGLEYRGRELAGHFSGLNPVWPDYVFNAMRGEVVPGRFGTIQHELYEVALGDDGEPSGGAYFGRRSVAKPGLRSLIGIRKDPPNEPFAAQAMWLPVTAVKVLVPEAALVPRLVVSTRNALSFTDRPLGDAAPSLRMASHQGVSDELQAAAASSMGPVLEWLGVPFLRLELYCGAVNLIVNGYRSDPGWLDALVRAVGSIAEACADLGRPWHVEAPFDAPLGSFDSSQHPPGYFSFDGQLGGSGVDVLEGAAATFGLSFEDPVALHRRFPRLAIPGTSRGVLSGRLPGSSVFGRLTWQYQNHPASSAYLRGGVLAAARADAPSMPVGGLLEPSTDMYVASADGVACSWVRQGTIAKLDIEPLSTRAVAAMQATGLLPSG